MSMDGVLKLYFGESNLPTPEFIKRAAQKAMADGFTFYTENAGLPSLRKASGALLSGAARRWKSTRRAKLSSPLPECRRCIWRFAACSIQAMKHWC